MRSEKNGRIFEAQYYLCILLIKTNTYSGILWLFPCAVLCLAAQSCLTNSFWTVARQSPLSTEILQARILSGLPCPHPGDLPNLGIEPMSPSLQVDSLPSEWPGKPKNTGGEGVSLSLLQRDLPNPGIKPWSLALQVGFLPAELPRKPTTPPIPLPKNCREQKEKQIKIPTTGACLVAQW